MGKIFHSIILLVFFPLILFISNILAHASESEWEHDPNSPTSSTLDSDAAYQEVLAETIPLTYAPQQYLTAPQRPSLVTVCSYSAASEYVCNEL